jgi:Yip1-like protein
MNPQNWTQLAITSVRNPAVAARVLMGMGFDIGSLWSALVLVAIGNTLLYSLSIAIFPESSPLSHFLSAPFVYFAIVAGGLTLTSVSIAWVGRKMGGKGQLADVLVLVVWMQALRLVVQVAVLVLVFVMPALSALLVLAAGLIGIYMLVNFVDQAHGFHSIGRAAMVLIASMLAIVVGLTLILTLVGGVAMGIPPNV